MKKIEHCLITGGAGFIGCNMAARLIREGIKVRIFDNLSRAGVQKNLDWLNITFPGMFDFIQGDVRDFNAVCAAVRDVDTIFHYASQVAVTTSVVNPRHDFEVNGFGTINVLEAARLAQPSPAVLFTSTNKVYGKLAALGILEAEKRYSFEKNPWGVDETQPLDFYSPYGCSKGAADQYVLDYARIYGMQTVVFRMSCIYGPHQFGNEDQGWVVHFVISALTGRLLNIYGDGKQVRDILYVEDLTEAFLTAARQIEKTAGNAFNIGGGLDNSISLLELMDILKSVTKKSIPAEYFDWRPGDQKVYVSNIARASRTFDWRPKISREEGVRRLCDWVTDNRHLFE
ncbi:MAG TPA: SDR family NAD(P)-dependent oxidoreductase [Candidatus Sumerlaeota bacterium]|nr:SDR family NAD(P)-dependent oxidoreductase [Candidatus Sumerlaeota bacterium]